MSEPKDLQKDMAAIRALADVLEETGLSEIEIERDKVRLRISKSSTVVASAAVAAPAAAPAAAGSAPAAGATSDAPHPGAVTSPMVGTAYMASSPGSPPFVSIGATVKEGQTVMIVEAMKTMNEIKSTRAGTVTDIRARDAEPVEYGEVLMIIE